MARRRRFRAAEALAALLLLALSAACGSRLPESDFEDGTRPDRTTPSTAGEPIRVGIITSATSPVGGNAFTGPRDGAKAYFEHLNAQGGIGEYQTQNYNFPVIRVYEAAGAHYVRAEYTLHAWRGASSP